MCNIYLQIRFLHIICAMFKKKVHASHCEGGNIKYCTIAIQIPSPFDKFGGTKY